ncbi:MAG: hypothetical protein ACQEQL_04800 [Pseudomonadota bacterium]
MYELLKDIYPRSEDRNIQELTRLEKDSERRIELMARRDEIYDELQKLLAEKNSDSQKIAVIEEKLEALRHMAEMVR